MIYGSRPNPFLIPRNDERSEESVESKWSGGFEPDESQPGMAE
jgi:hypothetical protein